MKLGVCSLALVLACSSLAFPQSVLLKVKIDGNRSNQERLLKALNSRGEKYKIKFSQVEADPDYRIVFDLGKTPHNFVVGSGGTVTGGTNEYDTGFVVVYDNADKELFRFKHEAFWSEAGAISGAAKHIVRRLHTWRRDHPPTEESTLAEPAKK